MDDVPEKLQYAFVDGRPGNKEADFPKPLNPVDDLPPITVITHVGRAGNELMVRGTTSDNGTVDRVLVNGQEAKPLGPNFSEWEVILRGVGAGELKLTAQAEDAAGNVERGTQLHRFLQAYAIEEAKIEARRHGHQATETQLADGYIKVTVQVGGAA